MKFAKNKDALQRQDLQRRYAIRKFSVGAASVAIGLFLAGGKPLVVHADTPAKAETTQVEQLAAEQTAQPETVQTKADPEQKAPVAPIEERAAKKVVPAVKATVPEQPAEVKKAAEAKKTEAEASEPTQAKSAEDVKAKTKAADKSAQKDETQKLAPDKKLAEKDAAKELTEEKAPARRSRERSNYSVLSHTVSSDYDIYDVSGWNVNVLRDTPQHMGWTGIGDATITDYHGTDSDVVMPNTSDLIDTGVITSGHRAQITGRDFSNILHNNSIKSLTVDTADPANCGYNKVYAYPGGEPHYSGDNDFLFNQSNNTNSWDAWASGGTSVTKLNLSGLDVSDLTSLGKMFAGATTLTDLDLSGWDTGKVKDFRSMFAGCSNLTNLVAPHLVTSAATWLQGMFSRATKLQTLHAGDWDTSNVTNMSGLFANDTALSDLSSLSNWDTGNVTNMGSMFASDTSLYNCDFLSGWNTGNVTNMTGMFDFCFVGKNHNDGRLDLSHWNVQKVQTMNLMFHNARFLKHLDTTGWKTTSLTDISDMFGAYVDPPSIDDPDDLGRVSKLETIEGIDDWDVSYVTTMSGMFEYCIALTDQVAEGIAHWHTPNLESIYNTFHNTRKLTRLDLHNWAPTKLSFLAYAFAGCNATYLNLSGWHLPASQNVSNRGVFDHLGLGQPVLIVMKGITVDPVGNERYFNLKDLNASTGPIDRSNSDLPVGPLVMIASDTDGNLAVRHNGEAITESNNHWGENHIRFMPQKPQTSADLNNWLIDNCDNSDPDHELNNLAFAFASEDEAQTYLLNQLTNYLNRHNLTNQFSHYVGHSTYYDWYSIFDWNTMQDVLVGRAKKYDSSWLGEGLNNPGPGTGDDYEKVRISPTQDEKITAPLTMSADNVRSALQNDQHTWADNFLPMLFSGIYYAEPIPEVTVTVQYKDVDTGQIVKTDPAISGHPGDTITLTFNIPAGYHEVAPEPSTSYTFTNTNGVVTVLVQRDATPTPPQPNPNPEPNPNPNRITRINPILLMSPTNLTSRSQTSQSRRSPNTRRLRQTKFRLKKQPPKGMFKSRQ